MKLGFGFYHHMLNERNYRFARQCGATHAVIHLVDYYHRGSGHAGPDNQPVGGTGGWGFAGANRHLWSYEYFASVRDEMARYGLTLEAIENFDPADWHDVLLDGPERTAQIERIRQILQDMGRAGIHVMGYNFSLAGVAARITGDFARGGASSVGMDGVDETPVPNGMVWNMIYDPEAPPGVLPEISTEELWRRHAAFLGDVLPAAEEAGVRLALHPDDPPVERMRRQPRLVIRPEQYQRVIDTRPSYYNSLELCLGTMMEMPEGDVYEALESFLAQDRIAYIHFRNVRGKAPNYKEVFIDEGDLDMHRVMRILHSGGYRGVLIPDHTPQMSCVAPWHAGMAYAMGYMNALKRELEK